MSTICGIHRLTGAPVDPGEIARMLDALDHWPRQARGDWARGSAALGFLRLRTSAEEPAPQPIHDAASGCTIAGDVRLDNRDTLAARLAADRGVDDVQLVLRAYLTWGAHAAAQLHGDFAFAIHDARRRRTFCARDMFGVKPFYYVAAAGTFAFASQIRGLLALPWVDRAVNDVWIADYLHRIAVDRTSTFYSAISRLEPGQALTAEAGGLRILRYRELDAHREVTFARDEDYVDGFREKLTAAVRRRMDGIARPAAELSGGLDSSAICSIGQRIAHETQRGFATFAQVQPDNAETSVDLPEDARWAIDKVRAHAGITETAFLSGDGGIIPSLERACRVLDEPPRNMVAFYNDDLYEAAAAKDVTVLLSGFGGNQGVSAVAFDRRRELLYSGNWAELGREVMARRDKRGPVRAILGLLWHEVDWHWLDARLKSTRFWQRQPERLAAEGLARRFGMRGRALRYAREGESRGTLREQAIAQLNLPIVAHRLEYAHHATASHGLEYRYPLFDEALIAFYLAVPSHLKFRRGVGRYLFRRSLDGVVPDEVRWEAGPRASANPGSVRRRRRDHDEIVARVAALPASSRVFDYVDRVKLAEALRAAGARPRPRYTEILMALMLDQKLRGAAS